MATLFQTTFETLESADVGGELETALEESSACDEYVPTTTQESVPPNETASGEGDCERFVASVEGYNTLLPGASRGEYLTLLHKLQRDCPAEARQAGLTGEGLPQCAALDQENCTMYEG